MTIALAEARTMSRFHALFGESPTARAVAPGRVNLIGEHTDYNGGFVLPTIIPQQTTVELRVRPDRHVRAASLNTGGRIEEFDLGAEQPGRGWLDFVQGVVKLLCADGHRLAGFDLLIRSDVPVGSGLSSSAALDVALMRALRSAFTLALDNLHIALLGRRVENEFVGAQVGIMDPMACSIGQPGTALFLDARSLQYELILLPPNADVVVLDSGVAHDHSAGDYNTRRSECEQACRLLGVCQLRDLGETDLPRLAALPDKLSRRARHVITENARVLATVAALRAGDLRRVGQLFFASHDSQRDEYAVSVPAIDLIVDLARQDSRVFGARLTGGGFGGSVVMLTESGAGRDVAGRVANDYQQRTGTEPAVLVPGPR